MILLSFLIALLLTTIPLPGALTDWRPAWLALMLIFWCMVLPERIGVGIAWLLGLILDAHAGALLGQNALALSLIAYLTLRLQKQIRAFPPLQHTILICMFLLLLQFINLWIRGIMGVPPQSWLFWAPVVSSVLLWPFFFYLMNRIRHRYNVF